MGRRQHNTIATTPDTLPAARITALRLPAVVSAISSYVTAKYVPGTVNKVVLTLTALPVTITDALAYGSQQLLDFAEGRVLVHGATASLVFAVTSTTRAATINDSASMTWSLGTAAASSITLASTMIDLLPKATKVLAAATTVANSASTNALAVAAQFDGTATAKDAFLNFGFETNTDIDGDGAITVTGTITILFSDLGDY